MSRFFCHMPLDKPVVRNNYSFRVVQPRQQLGREVQPRRRSRHRAVVAVCIAATSYRGLKVGDSMQELVKPCRQKGRGAYVLTVTLFLSRNK